MTVRSRTTVTCIALTIALGGAACAEFPANAEFGEGVWGWTVPEGCEVARAEGTRGALALAGGWAVSEAAEEPLTGWQRVQVRAKGPGKDAASSILLALVGPGAEPAAQAAVGAADAGAGWRTISAELPAPPGERPAVAVGVAGEGAWLIDSVTVAPRELPGGEASEPAPVLADPLPEGWEPDGLLDAISRPIGTTSELLVHVGGLEVALAPKVTGARAHRGTLRLTVRNRSMREKDLTVAVSGPPGFFAPERTVTIRPGADTVFSASVQAFFVGTRRARITFRAGDQEASAPLEVEVTPSYPAPGVVCWDADLCSSLPATLPAMAVPLVAAPLGPELPQHLTRLRLLLPPWSEQALLSAADRARGRAEFMAVHYPRGAAPDADSVAATRTLGRALAAAEAPVHLLGPPADLAPGASPAIDDRDLAVATELGAAGNIAAPSLRLPVLECRPARAVMIDRTLVASPQPSWSRLSAALAIEGAPAAIRRSARLPMFFADLAARSSGSDGCDAAVLARALTICAWQGATGWTIPARPQDAPEGASAFTLLGSDLEPNGLVAEAYCELSRELAAATPLTILKQTPQIGVAPDAAVGFRPFMRNDEGILALWNNTGSPVELIFEVRTSPLDVHSVAIGPDGLQRTYRGAFRFSDEAVALNRPVVFVSLGPGEFRVLSMQLARAHAGWLSSVEFRPKIPRGGDRPKSFLERWEERNLYN